MTPEAVRRRRLEERRLEELRRERMETERMRRQVSGSHVRCGDMSAVTHRINSLLRRCVTSEVLSVRSNQSKVGNRELVIIITVINH